MSNYRLLVDDSQLNHISKALDFYARIQMGQISEMVNPYMVPLPSCNYDEITPLITELKTKMFPDLPKNAYYSIKSSQLSDEVRQMVDIYEVIRFQLIADNETELKENDMKPFNWSSEKLLPVIEKVILADK